SRRARVHRHLRRRLPRLLFTRPLRYMIYGNSLAEKSLTATLGSMSARAIASETGAITLANTAGQAAASIPQGILTYGGDIWWNEHQ
ncbi:MAG: hypothetical protein ACREFE_17510, partial [Limisphaerales bacterium]